MVPSLQQKHVRSFEMVVLFKIIPTLSVPKGKELLLQLS